MNNVHIFYSGFALGKISAVSKHSFNELSQEIFIIINKFFDITMKMDLRKLTGDSLKREIERSSPAQIKKILIREKQTESYYAKKDPKKINKKILDIYESKIKTINYEIELYNKGIKAFNLDQKLLIDPIVNKRKIYDKKLKILTPNSNDRTNAYEKYHLFIDSLKESLNLLEFQITDNLHFLYKRNTSLQEIAGETKFLDEIDEVIDLHLQSYFSSSSLALGRLLENLLKKISTKLATDGKITKTKQEIEKMNFDSLIGFLKSKNSLTENEANELYSIRYDRNLGGHKLKDKEMENRKKIHDSIIKKGIYYVKILEDKLNNI
ncbi:hypothetical protein [Leptospira bandrabouensis]|uniref:Uncharacterized protein n=1 Tax=Leptospira bandrabouensis TaxID=2484903 RepID=A0A6H3NQZ7_9LEPT|nr:hypothetical protein [Leptospira bandrabouensis]MCG6154103.1 hypothetical protein [Leptospira bandrabouensis]TGN11574.1 hypothetical protein EHR08_17165 [Leptospira bandrabouensis]